MVNQKKGIHIVDGGYLETGDQTIEHIHTHYGDAKIDHVILGGCSSAYDFSRETKNIKMVLIVRVLLCLKKRHFCL